MTSRAQPSTRSLITEIEGSICYASTNREWPNNLLQLAADRLRLYDAMFTHAVADKTGVYFICGSVGELQEDGLPERILVCPMYGADIGATKVYIKGRMED